MNPKHFKTTLRNSTLLSLLLALATLLEASALPKIEQSIKKEGKTSTTLLTFTHPNSNHSIELVLHERSGPCDKTHARLGGYELKSDHLFLCTTYLYKGNFKGVMFEHYRIQEDRFALVSRELYFAHPTLDLLGSGQKPSNDPFIASYEKSFNANFTVGSEAKRLITHCDKLYKQTLRRLWRQGVLHENR